MCQAWPLYDLPQVQFFRQSHSDNDILLLLLHFVPAIVERIEWWQDENLMKMIYPYHTKSLLISRNFSPRLATVMFGQPSVTRKRLCRNNKLSLAETPGQGKAICEFCPRLQNNYVNRLYNHLRARSLYANIWKCLVYGEGVNNITLARP